MISMNRRALMPPGANFGSWTAAQKTHVADGGAFDQINKGG